MKITWLGQAGLLFETANVKIMVDPYLSNSVAEIEPQNQRRVPVDETFFSVKPDIIVLTHNHLDHTDPQTLSKFLNGENSVTVLASGNAWQTARKFGGNNNYVLFNRKTEWSQSGVRFAAVRAEHSDDKAVGVIIKAEGKSYYVTGDTLFNEEIFGDLPSAVDVVFLPVNGRGNNMNFEDAKRFCERIGAKAVPLHCGLFDDVDMHSFGYENKVVPEFYKEIKL